MGFPLGDWIDARAHLPHNLAQSGMRDSLRTVDRSLRRLPDSDPERLRGLLARQVGVRTDSLFLTHGATEGNGLVLQFLSTRLRRTLNRAPRLRWEAPEYPPLPDTGRAAGFDLAAPGTPADVAVASAPRNPTGASASAEDLARFSRGTRAQLIDETFREFTDRPSLARGRRPGLWTTGTFTKAYGGDALRVGFVTAPAEAAEAFAEYHSLVTDRVALHSVSGALALLRDRSAILSEARGILRTNERVLREAFPPAAPLAAPVWFDRVPDGDRLARRAVRAGVLVCPGSFFGVKDGVRLCLTRRSFPEDFEAYLAVRRRDETPAHRT